MQSKRKEAIHCQHIIKVAYDLIRRLLQRAAAHLCITKMPLWVSFSFNCITHDETPPPHNVYWRVPYFKEWTTPRALMQLFSQSADSKKTLCVKTQKGQKPTLVCILMLKITVQHEFLKPRDFPILSLSLQNFLLPSLAISAQEGLIRHMLTHKTLECGVKFKSTEKFYSFFVQ